MSARARLTIIALAALLSGCSSSVSDFFRGYAEGRSSAMAAYDGQTLTSAQRGAVTFLLSDFGALNTDALETHAVPWRLVAAAMVLRDVDEHGGAISAARLAPIMRRFGFLYPESVGNWPEGLAAPQPLPLGAPAGFSLGIVGRDIPRVRITAANLACAACHAGHAFDASGAPRTDTLWLGAPNTSLDLELYVREVYSAIKAARRDEARLLEAVRTLFPDTTQDEMNTLRDFVMPRLQSRMNALEAAGDRPLPFVNGAPGLTNGVAALRMQFGLLDKDAYQTARGFTSIPDLGARGFRAALLYDGAYAPTDGAPDRSIRADEVTQRHVDELAAVTAFFTVPSMGVHPDRADRSIAAARDVFAFLGSYRAPRFPGAVDAKKAETGRAIYAARCASCHGVYDENLAPPGLRAFPNWSGPFDTDPARAQVFTAETARAVSRSPYGRRMSTRATGQYSAPLLAGLWLTAPYLHNGSVPTLWHLMHPSERPIRFLVGGHRLDYTRMGVAGARAANGDYLYPRGYQPWSTPMLIDTQVLGLSNKGHDEPFDVMSETEKSALLEYLKLL